MDELCTTTSDLKQLLSELVDYKDKEEIISKHILAADKLNHTVEDFPSSLDWFNTTQALCSTHLQGKIVVLDFFTYCCINCLHVIPHLRELEENFSVADGLVVVGVHSAKFDNEKDSNNILLALKRYNITHPVVNDKNCFMWNKLNISCWPTIVILGPQRQVLFVLVGEGHRDELLLFVKSALKFYKKSISSHQLPTLPCDQIVTSNLLSFPGKISRWMNRFAVSDSGNHRIVVFDENGFIKFKVGGKAPGFKDGSFETCRFNSPQGLSFYNSTQIYVADTENHAIRLINLESLSVTTVVGTGRQGVDYEGGKVGTLQEISSPWDVCVVPCSDVSLPVVVPFCVPKGSIPPPPPPGLLSGPPPPPPSFPSGDPPPAPLPPQSTLIGNGDKPSNVLLIAAAGTHQIWAYFIESGVWWKGKKYEKNICVAVAGSGKEENRNNRYPMMASFAQPSGLTYSKDLKSVFIADSESSSIRKLSLKDGSVSHVAGGARSPNDLFSYGDVDGKGYEAKLQHPLGVIWSSKAKSVFVCDTYNHRIKKVDVDSGLCESLHRSRDLFSEPSGGCLNESEDVLFVCDTNNNVIKRINLLDGSINVLDLQEQSETVVDNSSKDNWEAETTLSKAGATLTLKIEFTPKEIHGKWTLQADEAKIRTPNLKGKMTTNVAEFVLNVLPSPEDDVIRIFFDLVLCGSETCSFKKGAQNNLSTGYFGAPWQSGGGRFRWHPPKYENGQYGRFRKRRPEERPGHAVPVPITWQGQSSNDIPDIPETIPAVCMKREEVDDGEPGEVKPTLPLAPPSPEEVPKPSPWKPCVMEDRNAFPTYRFMKIKKRIGIRPVGYPKVTLTPAQIRNLSERVLEKVLEEGEKARPRFFGSEAREGSLVLLCGDDTTVAWVKTLSAALTATIGMQLEVVEDIEENKMFVAVGYFPKSANDTNTRILKFLTAQNVDMDTSRWRVLNRENEEKEAVRLTLSIDFSSAGKMKARGPNLSYKFGCAKFQLLTVKGVKFKEEIDDECMDDFLPTSTKYTNPFYESIPSTSEEKRTPESSEGCQIPPTNSSEYQAQVERIVEKSKKTLLHGLNSRQRYLKKKYRKQIYKKQKTRRK